MAADPDVLVVASFAEGVDLLAELAAAGYPMAQVVGLDGLSRPDLATQLFPDDPAQADGLRVVRATGDRLITERLAAAAAERRADAVRRPDVRLRGDDRARRRGRGERRAGRHRRPDPERHVGRADVLHVRPLQGAAGGRRGHRLLRARAAGWRSTPKATSRRPA